MHSVRDHFEPSTKGSALAMATAAAPLRRETAERLIAAVVERAHAINADNKWAYRIGLLVLFGMRRYSGRVPQTKSGAPEPSDAEVRAILVSARAEVGADPALIYAFQKTGVYLCEENERRLSKSQLAAWNGAADEYYRSLAGRLR